MTAKKLKMFILSLFVIASSFLFWWKLSLFTYSASLSRLVLIGIFSLLFLCFSLIFMVLVDNRNILFVTYMIVLGLFFLFFQAHGLELQVYISALLLFLGLFVLGYEFISKEEKERRHISLRRIWKRGLPILIIGLSLIIAVVYYFNPLLKIKQKKVEIPTQFFSTVMTPFKSIIRQTIPFYQPGMTIDEMIITSESMKNPSIMANISPDTIKNIKKELNQTDFENLDTSQLLENKEFLKMLSGQLKENVPDSALEEKKQEIEDSLGVKVNGDETLDDIVAGMINDKLSNFIGPYTKEVSILIAVALFLFLRFLFGLLGFIIIIFSRLIIRLLIVLKVVEIKEAQVSKEFLRL